MTVESPRVFGDRTILNCLMTEGTITQSHGVHYERISLLNPGKLSGVEICTSRVGCANTPVVLHYTRQHDGREFFELFCSPCLTPELRKHFNL